MKVTILGKKVIVYRGMDLNTPLSIELVVGDEVEIVDTTKKDGVDWMKVILSNGEHGYILGDTKAKVVKEWSAAEMKKDLRLWGFLLIAFGIISIAIAWLLDPTWRGVLTSLGIFGGLLTVVGILALLIQRRGMFIVIGISLLIVGIRNIIDGGGWIILGFSQILLGIQEISKFSKYAPSKARENSTVHKD